MVTCKLSKSGRHTADQVAILVVVILYKQPQNRWGVTWRSKMSTIVIPQFPPPIVMSQNAPTYHSNNSKHLPYSNDITWLVIMNFTKGTPRDTT